MNHTKEKCLECNGTGLSGEHDRCDPPNYYVCDTCCGSGVIDKPCPYCRTDIDVEGIKTGYIGATAVILENRMLIDASVNGFICPIEISIYYCPMCGRKLEDV